MFTFFFAFLTKFLIQQIGFLLTMQMPRGVPVATVAINNSTNAGLLAARILGVCNADLALRLDSLSLCFKIGEI